MEWTRLGAVAPARLGPAREALHWGVQVIAAAGETFVAHQPDTGHTALVWLAGHRALAGAEIPGRWPCRVALRVADRSLLLLDRQGAPHAAFALEGHTFAEANLWAAEAIRTHTRGEHAHALVHPGFPLPPSALGQGVRFAAPGASLTELGLWYANADAELRSFANRTPGAGPVLCWPHHLDIATLVSLRAEKTLGLGLSPGDEGIPEPYAYVNHFPTQADHALPPLEAGAWHTAGWRGALLRGSELVAAGDAGAQRELWRRFVASAVAASRTLLAG